VLDIAVAGVAAVIGTTPNHPFWSVDRQDFVRADALHVGDRLKTLDGETTVTAISRRPGRHTVFNLEVQTTHVYNFAKTGVLVYNGAVCDMHHGTPREIINQAPPHIDRAAIRGVSGQPNRVAVDRVEN
jgi:hypothetical protein